MKKTIYAAVLALAVGAASCGKSSDGTEGKFFSPEATDSLLISFGKAAGYGLNMQITNAMEADSTITKEAFLRGLQYAMACDTADAYMNGVITGLQIQTQLKRFARMGVDVNTSVVLDNFKAALMADSLPSQTEMTAVDAQYRMWSDSLNAAKRQYDLQKLETSPEAIENAEKGDNYIKTQKAQNDSVQISETGLGYKIINAGTGDKVDPNGRVTLNYTIRTTNGRVLDQVNGYPVVLAQRIAGLREGVSKLGVGGKAILYVPGKLAYGVEVPQRMNLGLNEVVVVDVEVLDVPKAPATGVPVPASMNVRQR